MGKIGRGLTLMKASWEILKEDKKIMILPLVSMVLSLAIIVTFFAPLFFLTGFDLSPEIFRGFRLYIYLFALYAPLFFVGTFFNTAVVACADARIKGKRLSIKGGLKVAYENWYKILLWALLAGTVGVLLQLLRDKLSILGHFVSSLAGIAWTYATFFIVPVLIFEERNVLDSVKKSGGLFVDTWGETLAGSIGFGIIIFILGFAGLLPLLLLTIFGIIGWMIALILGFLYIVLLSAFSSALNGIFVTALYHYARNGKLYGPFTLDMIPSPVSSGSYPSREYGDHSGKEQSSVDLYYSGPSWRR
ncbi:MAG: DUF6159 family protein [Thermoplasmata archaeon]